MEFTSVAGSYGLLGRPYRAAQELDRGVEGDLDDGGRCLELRDGARGDVGDDRVDQADVLLDVAAEGRYLLVRGGAVPWLISHDHGDEVRPRVSRGGQRGRVSRGGERAGAEQEGGRSRHRTDGAPLAIVPADSLYRIHPW